MHLQQRNSDTRGSRAQFANGSRVEAPALDKRRKSDERYEQGSQRRAALQQRPSRRDDDDRAGAPNVVAIHEQTNRGGAKPRNRIEAYAQAANQAERDEYRG